MPPPTIEIQEYESELQRRPPRRLRAERTRHDRPSPQFPKLLSLPDDSPASGPAAIRRADRLRSTLLIASDATAVVLAILAVAGTTALPLTLGGLLVALAVTFGFTRLAGLLDKDAIVVRRSTLDEAPRLLEMSALLSAAYWLTLPEGPGRLPLLVLVAALAVAVVGARVVTRAVLRQLLPQRCLFIGDMSVVDTVRRKVEGARTNAAVVAALPLESDRSARDFEGVEGLQRIVAEAGITRIILAPPALGGSTLELIRVAKEAHVPVSIFPRMMEVVGTAVEAEELEGMTLLGVRRFGLSPSAHKLKRGFDLAVSAAITVCALPVLGLIALAVKLDSRGPVLFRQERVGRDGKRFSILKFRSMVVDADERKHELRAHNETEGLFKIADDPRVTRVGRLLRKTSLDELPQILNVLRGEMSLVGPRPLVVDEDVQVSGLHRRRLHLTPGMTGPWQVMRSGRVPMQEMVSIDYLYVANWSLWTDLKLLMRTISYVLARGGV